MVAALIIRILFVGFAAAHPDWFNWQTIDPELYASRAAMLVDSGHWAWTFRAVSFVDTGVTGFIKAPLYQVFLSLFTSFPDYPAVAPLGHAVLGALTILAIFFLTAQLHSHRAALVAAALSAVWFTAIAATAGFWQEHLYNLSMTLGVALLVRAVDVDARPRDPARAGAALGLATLARSMPLVLAPLSLIWMRRGRWLAAGVFAAIVVPYIVWLSVSVEKFVPVENIGAAFLRYNDPPNDPIAARYDFRDISTVPFVPFRQFAADPVWYTRAIASRVRDTLTMSSHDWLEHVIILPDEHTASRTKAIAIAGDALVAIVLVLAPFGVALARNRRGAAIVATWIVAAVLLTAVTGHNGTRYRWALDPLLIALAAIVRDPGSRGARERGRWSLAAVASALMLGAVVTAVPRLARAHATYGVAPWHDIYSPSDGWVLESGRAGFVVQRIEGWFALSLRCPADGVTRAVDIRVDGTLRSTLADPACRAGTRVFIQVPGQDRAYTQLDARPAGRLRLTVTFE